MKLTDEALIRIYGEAYDRAFSPKELFMTTNTIDKPQIRAGDKITATLIVQRVDGNLLEAAPSHNALPWAIPTHEVLSHEPRQIERGDEVTVEGEQGHIHGTVLATRGDYLWVDVGPIEAPMVLRAGQVRRL